MKHIKMTLRGYLIAGLLIWLPIAITLWVLNLIIGTLDQTVNVLPQGWRPESLFGFDIPGLGVVLAFAVLLGTGFMAANVLGQRLLDLWELVLTRTPVVKTIYNSVKQVSDTLLSDSGQAFRKALLVRFPHQNAWTIAFQTGAPSGEVKQQLGEDDFISVYVPTTPNPTSGYLEIVPVEKMTPTDWTVDQAMSFLISGGAVAPDTIPFSAPGPAARPAE
jgi:uncharacterized membrane protein